MINPTFRLGTIRRIPVGIHWSLVLAIGFIGWVLASGLFPSVAPGFAPLAYWIAGIVAGAGLFGSVLAHEFGHSLVARRNGVGVASITLWMLGGVSALDHDPERAGSAFRIAIAGPVVSVALAVICGALGSGIAVIGAAPLWAAALGYLALANAVLALFNLLPAAPLDGGRILAAAIWAVRGDRFAAQAAAAACGQVAGIALGGFGIVRVVLGDSGGFWMALLGAFIVVAATTERRVARIRRALAGVRVGELAVPAPAVAAWSDVATLFATPRPPGASFVPLVGWSGDFAGVVSMTDLAPIANSSQRLDRFAVPAELCVTAGPDEDMNRVLDRLRPGWAQTIVVVDDRHRPYAVVTPDIVLDRTHAIRRSGPVPTPPAGPGPAPDATRPSPPPKARPLPQ